MNATVKIGKEIENEKNIPVAPLKCSSSACVPVAPGTVTGATGISSSGRHEGALLLLLCSSSGCLRALLLQVSCSALAVARGGALLISKIGALLIAFLLVVSGARVEEVVHCSGRSGKIVKAEKKTGVRSY